jgi:hypothetical protein
MLRSLKNLFREEVAYKSVLPFSPEELSEWIRTNRNTLELVEDWIDPEAFSRSYFKYGVPDFIKAVINKPIGDAPTYTDLMALLASRFLPEVNYLEIGVSVGKNFFQLLNAFDKARFSAFDIEEINPVLARKLEPASRVEWPTPGGSIKKKPSSLSEFRFKGKKVAYLSGDVWDSNSWARLEGNKFNLVFSDALHTPKAILFEFEMLAKYKLLDQRFIIVWDDLVGKMQQSFFKIIRKYNEAYGIKEVYLLNLNGWVGENEDPHTIGIISNFAF